MTPLWAGRFGSDMAASVLDFTKTTDIDVRLIGADLWVNLAHVIMLRSRHLIDDADGRAIAGCLLDLMAEADAGCLALRDEYEDVHLNIEQLLIARLGLDVGGRINLARSRNDQVVTDTRLYLREALICIQREGIRLVEALLGEAARHLETPAIGYTHGQPAQPISLAFWLSGYASVFTRDMERIGDAYARVDLSPLGSCAVAGTSLPISRAMTSALLGFAGLIDHALDATSSRDFVVEAIADLAVMMSHFSKLAEEIVVWSSAEFRLIDVDDSFATGSSIMPQKKNPVVAELVRARTGRAYASLVQILTTVKGVPMGYSCDLQEDKPPLWDALDVALSTIAIMREHIGSMRYDAERARRLLNENFSTATELANHLATDARFSFREAHQIVGALTRELIRGGKTLADVDAALALLEPSGITIDRDAFRRLTDPVDALSRQTSEGGTAPRSVRVVLQRLTGRTDSIKRRVERNARLIRDRRETVRTMAGRFVAGAAIEDVLGPLTAGAHCAETAG